MKKLYVVTALALASIALAGAEGEGKSVQAEARQIMVKVRSQEDNQQATTTGDANTDSQVKALTKEMEAKIQAIRGEYMIKIKAIIASKKVITRPMLKGTTTPSGLERGEKKGFDEGNKLGRPMMGSTTFQTNLNEAEKAEIVQNIGLRVKNFLQGLLGGK